ncbi:hypothetical protein ASZ78_016733 [Callipepla squamata]|uniref:Cysteine protease n=1 Tax=Callipepla squamata TaxID=9009 RepID=A0A226NJK7_CALSU|nr:hypothetical protein ASZ78_016733 [Callipepla squamata]
MVTAEDGVRWVRRAGRERCASPPVLSRCENHVTVLADCLEEFPDTDEPVWILGRQHQLNADWQWEKHKEQPEEYHRILRCFLDRKDCCYSIHQMAQMGVGEGKSIGEWFGPNTVAQVLKKLALFDEWNSLAVYVSMDNTVVIEDISNELIYLDPHTTQSFVDSEENGTVDDQSFHCQHAPHRMKIMNLDPSVALGFFCKEECDFDNWCSLVQKEILKQQSLRMFELVQKHPPHWPPFIPPSKPEVTTTGAELIESTDKLFELEEEFEILSV